MELLREMMGKPSTHSALHSTQQQVLPLLCTCAHARSHTLHAHADTRHAYCIRTEDQEFERTLESLGELEKQVCAHSRAQPHAYAVAHTKVCSVATASDREMRSHTLAHAHACARTCPNSYHINLLIEL